jgi:hypothetical protein
VSNNWKRKWGKGKWTTSSGELNHRLVDVPHTCHCSNVTVISIIPQSKPEQNSIK